MEEQKVNDALHEKLMTIVVKIAEKMEITEFEEKVLDKVTDLIEEYEKERWPMKELEDEK